MSAWPWNPTARAANSPPLQRRRLARRRGRRPGRCICCACSLASPGPCSTCVLTAAGCNASRCQRQSSLGRCIWLRLQVLFEPDYTLLQFACVYVGEYSAARLVDILMENRVVVKVSNALGTRFFLWWVVSVALPTIVSWIIVDLQLLILGCGSEEIQYNIYIGII